MSRLALKWGAHPVVWLLSASLALTPYAFAQESAEAREDAPVEGASEPAAEPEAATESQPAELAEDGAVPEAGAPAGLEAPAEAGEPPASADQALQQDGTPSLVSPEQVGGAEAQAAQGGPAAPEAAGERAPSLLEKVPWWVWALGGAAVLVLAGALSGGGGGGGGGGGNDKQDGDSDSGTVGYSW